MSIEWKAGSSNTNHLKDILTEDLTPIEQGLEDEAAAIFDPELIPAEAGRDLAAVDIASFVEKTMCWRDERRMDFTFRPWWRRVYQSEHLSPVVDGKALRPKRRTLLKTGRQCEKSTSLGNKMLAFTSLMRNVTGLFVSSALQNAKEFSEERVTNVLRISPILNDLVGVPLADNVYTKRFQNNSRIVIRATSVATGASRVRGVAADMAIIDEIQDINPEDIPVITAATKNSQLPLGPIHIFAGTPLAPNNPIEQLWSKDSTRNIWMTKCPGCRHWNPPYPESLGRRGMVCARCGKGLNPLTGSWVSERTRNLEDIAYEGYHISRLIMPYSRLQSLSTFEDAWEDFYTDATSKTASTASIYNELYGLSYGTGRVPIQESTLMAMCHPEHRSQRHVPDQVLKDSTWPVFAGIDWGEGTGEGAYTVLSIGFLAEQDGHPVTHVHYLKRYEGAEADPAYVKEDIARLLTENDVTLCLCDAGHGWGMIDYLWDNVPDGRNRVFTMAHTNQNKVLTFDQATNRFACNRTRWMAKMFSMLERRSFRFPNWDEFREPFAQDILNIYVDRSQSLRQMKYSHVNTDDTFHSLLYLQTAKLFYYRELEAFVNA